MIKWPKIRQFSDVVKFAKMKGIGKVKYKCKVKLDGTNAAIVETVNGFSWQSREREITPEDDNFGFARWAKENCTDRTTDKFAKKRAEEKPESAAIANSLREIIFGEWIGPGIVQSKEVATAKLPQKRFVAFAMHMSFLNKEGKRSGEWICDSSIISSHTAIDFIGWANYPEIEIDFQSEASMREAVSKINNWVLEVETECPYMKTLGISGIGEGLVFYPDIVSFEFKEDAQTGQITEENDLFSNLIFKAKGQKHRQVNSESAAKMDIQKLDSINKFVEYFCTEQRFSQGLEKLGGEKVKSLTGKFVQWLSEDVKSESSNELEASNLTWNEVKGGVENTARKWWLS